jgi:hypothetical protein
MMEVTEVETGEVERIRGLMPLPERSGERASRTRRGGRAGQASHASHAGHAGYGGPAGRAGRADPRRPASGAPGASGAPAAMAAPLAPALDPFDDADALSELEDRILVLSAHIEASEQRRLEMIAEFDRRRGWELGGHRSAAHWLAARAGLDLGTAREKVRVARALEELPLTSAWLAMGRITFSQARALTRVATADDEMELLELARGRTVAEAERIARGWRLGSAAEGLEREAERHASRSFSVVPDLDGMYVVRGRLTPEQGAVLMRAIEAASDVLFREADAPGRGGAEAYEVPAELTEETGAAAARRRADAVAFLAECALGAGFGARKAEGVEDAEGASSPHPLSGTRASRYQVMLHVELDALRAHDATGGAGCSHLADGVRVSHETSRRVACDTAVVPLFVGAGGDVVDAGHARRVVQPALRRALEARDRGCRFPGCGLRYTEAHHVEHWADGGETSLENCLLLCRHHHRLVHEGGWRMESVGGGRVVFRDPRGGAHYDGRFTLPWAGGSPERRATPGRTTQGRAARAPADALRALVLDNLARGVRITKWGERVVPGEGGGELAVAGGRWERPFRGEGEE